MESDMNLMISIPSQEQASTLEEALTQELSNQEHGESGDNSFGSREEFTQELYSLDHLPPGYGFIAKDQDLIKNYLKKKINNEPIPYNRIRSVNVYKHNPQKLADMCPSLGDNEWYFFTPRDRKYLNGNRPNRAAGNGFWKATGSDQQIYHNNACIGSKKSLVFYEGRPPNCKKTNWIMKEYIVDQPSRQQTGTNDMLLDNCVLCRIHMKTLESSENKEQADTPKSCKTRKKKTIKSPEKDNQATLVKFEHQVTSQQHNLPGQHNIAEHRSLPVLEPNLPEQRSLPVLEPNLPEQRSLPVLEPNLPMQHSLPVLEPNLPMQQQNLPILQYDLLPENYSFGNNFESFYGLNSNYMVDHRPNALLNNDSFRYYDLPPVHDICDFTSYSSMDCSSPELQSTNNIYHLREGSSSGKKLSRGTRNV